MLLYLCCLAILPFLVVLIFFLFFFKQKTAYEMRISDWSSDVCSSDLTTTCSLPQNSGPILSAADGIIRYSTNSFAGASGGGCRACYDAFWRRGRSEEHTSELQSLMRISYAVFCLKKKKKQDTIKTTYTRGAWYAYRQICISNNSQEI